MNYQDPLSIFIQHLSPKINVFAQVNLREPWGIAEPQIPSGAFSYVRQGQCLVNIEGHDAIRLNAGQMLLLPYGCAHQLKSEIDVACLDAEHVFGNKSVQEIQSMVIGGDGKTCEMLCGTIQFSLVQHWGRDANFGGIPKVILVNIDHSTKLSSYIEWIYQENQLLGAGHELAVRHLLDLFFLEMLRGLNTFKLYPSWLQALNDKYLSKTVLAIQQNYHFDWSLEQLAQHSALSRSAFADRFKKTTGTTPLLFLRQWRCFVAAQLLANTATSIQTIANKVGFQSADVFIRNFKQFHSVTPKQYRLKQTKIDEKSALID